MSNFRLLLLMTGILVAGIAFNTVAQVNPETDKSALAKTEIKAEAKVAKHEARHRAKAHKHEVKAKYKHEAKAVHKAERKHQAKARAKMAKQRAYKIN